MLTRRYPNNSPDGRLARELTPQDVTGFSARDAEALLAEVSPRLLELHQEPDGTLRDKSPAEQSEFAQLLALRDAADLHLKVGAAMRNPRAVRRAGAEVRESGGRALGPQPGERTSRRFSPSPEFLARAGWVTGSMAEVFTLDGTGVRDRALSALEERGEDLGLGPDQLDLADALLRSVLSAENPNCDGSYIARRVLITESPSYRSAFRQLMTEAHPLLTAEEIEAVRALKALEASEFRAMNEGTGSAGGLGVPVFIDPTVILTSGAGAAPILDVCRVERITTNQWKGVSAASMTWSWDPEGSAVSDDSPTLAQPTVPVYMGRGFLPYSIELGQDYPGFADEMAKMLSQGSLDMLAASTATGSGTAQPTGVITKLQATAGSQVRVTTAGSIAAQDVFKVWNALPERFRSQPSTGWGMSVSVESTIRAFSSANQSSAYFTVDLAAEGITYLNGKRVTRSDYFPAITGATSTQAFAVVGDWSSYLVAMRAGMSIEPIPMLFDTSTGRPTGQRGFFAWLRSGHDCINPAGFRVLDQT